MITSKSRTLATLRNALREKLLSDHSQSENNNCHAENHRTRI